MEKFMNMGPYDSSPDKILDGLFLGDIEAAHNKTHLQSLGVTHILTVGSGLSQPHKDIFAYKHIPVFDMPSENLHRHFRPSIEFIEEGRKGGGVLVHCAAGISRSSTITIAYIMSHEKLDFDDAYKFVHSKHWICPNHGFVEQLKRFENELKKEREQSSL